PQPARLRHLDDRGPAAVDERVARLDRSPERVRDGRGARLAVEGSEECVHRSLAAVGDRHLDRLAAAGAQAARERRGHLGGGERALEAVGRCEDLVQALSRAARKARSASSPRTANTIRSSRPSYWRATPTMIRAASSSGKPPTPVPNATSASERAPSSSAFWRVERVAFSTISADVVPPGCAIVAAWITQRAGMSPAVVSTASPTSIGAFSRDSRSRSGPAARAIAPATPPPCRSCALA